MRKSDASLLTSAACLTFAALLYLIASLLLFGRGLLDSNQLMQLGHASDPSHDMWFLKWWPYAFSHHINPFHTRLLWYPVDTTLMWTSTVFLPAVVMTPITNIWGPVASYNILMLAAPVLAATAAFMLCRKLSSAYWPSVLGGFIFGFSPYMLTHMMGHLVLVMIFPVPLAVLITLYRIDGSLSRRGYIAALAALLVIAFLCNPEIPTTMTLFGALALGLGMVLLPSEYELKKLVPEIGIAYGLMILIVSPFIVAMLAYGMPHGMLWQVSAYSADLVGFVIPALTTAIGAIPAISHISNKFTGTIFENTACLTIPLLVIAAVYLWSTWRSAGSKLLALMLVCICIAAMGPRLHLMGQMKFWMPWAIAERMPFLKQALPLRLMLYAFLVLAIVTAMWFAKSCASTRTKWIAAVFVVAFLLPNPSSAFWVSSISDPPFFSKHIYRDYLTPDDVVLPLPCRDYGYEMLWHAQADFSFRMVGAWITEVPYQFRRLPIEEYFMRVFDLPEAPEHLKAFLAHYHVTAVVVDQNNMDVDRWSSILADIGLKPIETGGILLYRVPQSAFSAYARISAEQLEQRAAEMRFQIVVNAANKYLEDGGDICRLKSQALFDHDLLPADWPDYGKLPPVRLVEPRYRHSWTISGSKAGIVIITLNGTSIALDPLRAKYDCVANRIIFPFPFRDRDPGFPPKGFPLTMLMVFKTEALHVIAQRFSTQRVAEPADKFWPQGNIPTSTRRPTQTGVLNIIYDRSRDFARPAIASAPTASGR